MNLIEKLGLKKCKAIVEGAPENSTGFNYVEDDEYNCYVIVKREWDDVNKHSYWHQDALTGIYRWAFMANVFSGYNMLAGLIDLNDLRTAIAEHDSKDGIKKNDFKIGDFIRYMGIDGNTPMFGVYEVVGFSSTQVGGDGYQIKNKLGQIDFCYGDNYALVDCGITDDCTDIHNHVSPNTVVIER